MAEQTLCVSTHSRLKAAGQIGQAWQAAVYVSTHSRLKAAGWGVDAMRPTIIVSTHSRLKAAGHVVRLWRLADDVSTHSRLKAAGINGFFHIQHFCSFNTQPPEGGWPNSSNAPSAYIVSTHSRLKAAGRLGQGRLTDAIVSTHSRLKAAGPPFPPPAWRFRFQHTAA